MKPWNVETEMRQAADLSRYEMASVERYLTWFEDLQRAIQGYSGDQYLVDAVLGRADRPEPPERPVHNLDPDWIAELFAGAPPFPRLWPQREELGEYLVWVRQLLDTLFKLSGAPEQELPTRSSIAEVTSLH